MNEIASYTALFASAFLSATLLPGSSEAALIALLAAGTGDPATLIAVATMGNVLGSVVNWLIGRFFAHFRDRRWFPVGERSYNRAAEWYGRYGIWSLLFAWLPVVGDPPDARRRCAARRHPVVSPACDHWQGRALSVDRGGVSLVVTLT